MLLGGLYNFIDNLILQKIKFVLIRLKLYKFIWNLYNLILMGFIECIQLELN